MKIIIIFIYLSVLIVPAGLLLYLAYKLNGIALNMPFPENMFAYTFVYLIVMLCAYLCYNALVQYRKIIRVLDGDVILQENLEKERLRHRVETGRLNGIILFIGFSILVVIGFGEITKETLARGILFEAVYVFFAVAGLRWAVKSWKK